MRKVELPLAKGRRRDSKKPSLMVKKDGMILEKQHRRAVTSFPFREGFLSPVRVTERVVKPIVAWLGCGALLAGETER